MKEENAIEIVDLYKKYCLGSIGRKSFSNDLKKKLWKEKGLQQEVFWALNGVTLEIKKGEALGIIGTNGAGKSTMLKILSRVTAPTAGKVYIKGKLTSMLEVGTGFHGELTGRQNIYLNGAILGMKKAEIDKKMGEIIEFSECEKFIDTPVKRYSSGMYVKLAFSVASHLESDIMIMDEVLAVGDINFQKKCLDKMKELVENNHKTVLYVSHNMGTIRRLCSSCIVIEKGKIAFQGDVEKAIRFHMRSYPKVETGDFSSYIRTASDINHHIEMNKIQIIHNKEKVFEFGDKLELKISFICKKEIEKVCFRLVFFTDRGEPVGTAITAPILDCKTTKEYSTIYQIDIARFSPENYQMNVIAFQPNGYGGFEQFDAIDRAISFSVISTKDAFYNLEWLNHAWGNIYVESTKLE